MFNDEIQRKFEEAQKLGMVRSTDWQSYTWKNELAEQKRRIDQHLGEALEETETEHSPYHMLERAIGVAAVCMRRLIECRLVTDRFRETPLEVHEILVKAGVGWREPFVRRTASEIFNNYDLRVRRLERRTPKVISGRMLHARVIGVLSTSSYLPDGLLIASDTQSKTQLFHFTPPEITAIFDAFLNDQVRSLRDGYLRRRRNAHRIRDQRIACPFSEPILQAAGLELEITGLRLEYPCKADALGGQRL